MVLASVVNLVDVEAVSGVGAAARFVLRDVELDEFAVAKHTFSFSRRKMLTTEFSAAA